MPAEAPVDDWLVEPDLTSRVAQYVARVKQLRALGCGCPLRCEMEGRRRFRLVPLNESVAATCPVDHARSYTT